MMIRTSVLMALFVFSLSLGAKTLIWDMQPLSLVLPVNKERIVSFERPTQVRLPASINEYLEVTILEGKHYYIMAKKAFKTTRVFATSDNGQPFIIELSASKHHQDDSQVLIVTKSSSLAHVQTKPSDKQPAQKRSRNDQYIALMRFAAQQAYAPQRVIEGLTHISRVNVPLTSVQMIRGQPQLNVKPLASWFSSNYGLYVTMLETKNQGLTPIVLDPRRVRGTFLAAGFQHGRVLSASVPGENTTALYVISDRPFKEALGPWAIR